MPRDSNLPPPLLSENCPPPLPVQDLPPLLPPPLQASNQQIAMTDLKKTAVMTLWIAGFFTLCFPFGIIEWREGRAELDMIWFFIGFLALVWLAVVALWWRVTWLKWAPYAFYGPFLFGFPLGTKLSLRAFRLLKTGVRAFDA